MPPALPMWLRMVKEVRQPRLRLAMHVPFTIATRRLFSGTLCAADTRVVSACAQDRGRASLHRGAWRGALSRSSTRGEQGVSGRKPS